jgi:hypothetical protein
LRAVKAAARARSGTWPISLRPWDREQRVGHEGGSQFEEVAPADGRFGHQSGAQDALVTALAAGGHEVLDHVGCDGHDVLAEHRWGTQPRHPRVVPDAVVSLLEGEGQELLEEQVRRKGRRDRRFDVAP